jgi:hypothetical protein
MLMLPVEQQHRQLLLCLYTLRHAAVAVELALA